MTEQPSPRLYIGNLPYSAQRADIEDLFAKNSIGIKNLDISTDAFTGRNPSYCFVDLHTEEDASRAASTMQGQLIRGRPVKIRANTDRKSKATRSTVLVSGRDCDKLLSPQRFQDSPVFDRWTRNDAESHWLAPAAENRRLYVGGLPYIPRQLTLDVQMRKLFQGFDIQAVSKIIWPHSSKAHEPGSHFYAFVDFATAEEATGAVSARDGSPTPYGGKYKISCAQRNKGSAVVHREQLGGSSRIVDGRVFVGGLPELRDVEGEMRMMFTGRCVKSVGRLLDTHGSKRKGDRHFFCFVDFESAAEAQATVDAFQGNEIGFIVDLAREGAGHGDGGKRDRPPPETEVVSRDFSRSWRRQDGQ